MSIKRRAGWVLAITSVLGGCTNRTAVNPKNWFVESYENGVITVRHENNTYRAKCYASTSINNTGSISDPKDAISFPTCDTVTRVVGREIQPWEGDQADAEGWVYKMYQVGGALTLREWRDVHTPWRLEEFKIASVTAPRR